MTHVMDAIRKAMSDCYGSDPVGIEERDGSLQGMREDLLAVLRHLPRELTVGEMLRELEES